MLTKNDLLAIEGIVEKGVDKKLKPIQTQLNTMQNSIVNLEVGLKDVSNQVRDLDSTMKQGFKEVIDLVSPAFTAHERILGKHEIRITHLEKASPQN